VAVLLRAHRRRLQAAAAREVMVAAAAAGAPAELLSAAAAAVAAFAAGEGEAGAVASDMLALGEWRRATPALALGHSTAPTGPAFALTPRVGAAADDGGDAAASFDSDASAGDGNDRGGRGTSQQPWESAVTHGGAAAVASPPTSKTPLPVVLPPRTQLTRTRAPWVSPASPQRSPLRVLPPRQVYTTPASIAALPSVGADAATHRQGHPPRASVSATPGGRGPAGKAAASGGKWRPAGTGRPSTPVAEPATVLRPASAVPAIPATPGIPSHAARRSAARAAPPAAAPPAGPTRALGSLPAHMVPRAGKPFGGFLALASSRGSDGIDSARGAPGASRRA
jgi:hypothetical protein